MNLSKLSSLHCTGHYRRWLVSTKVSMTNSLLLAIHHAQHLIASIYRWIHSEGLLEACITCSSGQGRCFVSPPMQDVYWPCYQEQSWSQHTVGLVVLIAWQVYECNTVLCLYRTPMHGHTILLHSQCHLPYLNQQREVTSLSDSILWFKLPFNEPLLQNPHSPHLIHYTPRYVLTQSNHLPLHYLLACARRMDALFHSIFGNIYEVLVMKITLITADICFINTQTMSIHFILKWLTQFYVLVWLFWLSFVR